jgi:phytol kinase
MSRILTVLAVLVILVGNEAWWRKKHRHGEISRKLVHIIVGSFVAFWPFYLGWTEIELLSISFFIVVIVSKHLHIFQAIHSVQRPTWGELFFALAVGGVALMTHNKWIYMTAILQMSLADGLAAIMGANYGNRVKYSIFGHTKSLVGSLTFLVVSFILLLFYYVTAPHVMFSDYFYLIALSAAALENISIFGLDNLVVPILITVTLKAIAG